MYSLKDISNMTQLTTRTLQNHLKDGLLKGTKIGRSWRFSQEDLKTISIKIRHKDLSEKAMSKWMIFIPSSNRGLYHFEV